MATFFLLFHQLKIKILDAKELVMFCFISGAYFNVKYALLACVKKKKMSDIAGQGTLYFRHSNKLVWANK